MGKELSTAVFDYSVLDKDAKGKLISLAGSIKREKAKHAASGMAIGESVAAAHAILAGEGGDGKFSEWVELECGFGRTSAYNYLWTWQKFGNCSTVEQFDAGALYALASPKAPPKAVAEAEKLADKGHKITLDKARELLDKFRVVEAKPGKDAGKGTTPQEPDPRPPRNGTDKPEVASDRLGKCPNCAGAKWTKDNFGFTVCAKCGHPHGEPTGGTDENRLSDQRSKTVKTVEALMRAFGDLHMLVPKEQAHEDAIATCKILLKTAKGWK